MAIAGINSSPSIYSPQPTQRTSQSAQTKQTNEQAVVQALLQETVTETPLPKQQVRTPEQRQQDANDAQNILNSRMTEDAATLSNARTGDWLTNVESNLERIQELSVDASKAYTDAYKSFLQEEIDVLKEDISKQLDGKGMSLESLGIEDFDVTKEFSTETIDDALKQIRGNANPEDLPDPTSDTLNTVKDNLTRLQELSENASTSTTDAYKNLIQGEVDEIKETISQSLEGTNMSLESLGLDDFDVTGKFSTDTVDEALTTVTEKIEELSPSTGTTTTTPTAPSDTVLKSVQEDLTQMEKLSQYAQDASTNAYKKMLQEQIDDLKTNIGKNLDGTTMSLESLGLEDYDVTGKFSIDKVEDALKTVTDQLSESSGTSGETTAPAPSNEQLDSIEEYLKKIEELALSAQDSTVNSYKDMLQKEIDELKESITKELEGTNMSLESLGLEDFDITEEFSMDSVYKALEKVTGEDHTPEEEGEESTEVSDRDYYGLIEKPGMYSTIEDSSTQDNSSSSSDGNYSIESIMQDFSSYQSASYLQYQNISSLLTSVFGV